MMISTYAKKLILGIIGIYIIFICLSYYTEKIYNHPYKYFKIGKDRQQKKGYFKYPSLITWAGCLLCTVYGAIVAKLTHQKPNPIHKVSRIKLGLLFCLNILPSNFALLYISYQLQVVTKASRYFFLILFGAFFSKNQQIKELIIPKSKIIIAILIMCSTFLFIFEQTTNRQDISHFKSSQKWMGITLLAIAVVSDAFFVDQQAFCKSNFNPTANHLFSSYNFYAFLIIFLSALIGGTLFPSLRFCVKHPSIIWDICSVCILQLISQQIAINLIIVNFKQYIYPLISSTRRIVVLIASIFLFEHNLSYLQWTSVFFICFGIIAQLIDELRSKESIQSFTKIQNDEQDHKILDKQKKNLDNILIVEGPQQ